MSAATQRMTSTTKKPRRTGGVVGRGGGSSKPNSWGLNEAIANHSPSFSRQSSVIGHRPKVCGLDIIQEDGLYGDKWLSGKTEGSDVEDWWFSRKKMNA